MEMKKFIEKGYIIKEYIETISEYETDMEQLEEIETDELEPSDITGDLIETHFPSEIMWYSIEDKDNNVVADELDFDELIETIKSL